jgi:hypothetical protein
MKYRLTESNDYLGGVPDGSNSFASALWALDYMHWWAEHHASGVNFHNNQWIYTDTLAPRNNLWKSPGTCKEGPCTEFYITPKGYGIKAFNVGGHGYPLETSVRASGAPMDWSLTAYAVGAGQNRYVTVINKMDGNKPEHVAQVTINSENAPFEKVSVATMTLSSGVPGDATRLTAELAGEPIASTGEQWRGTWTPQIADGSGRVTLSVEPATAVIVHFRVGSRYQGPIGINENGSLEVFASDHRGRVWHAWQKVGNDMATVQNNGVSPWSAWSDAFSYDLPAVNESLAIARNQDNTLQAFAATAKGVYTARQEAPGGTWSHWAVMGGVAHALHSVQAAQNADGSLSIFGMDAVDNLWMATEAAPGVAWSSWKMLPKLAAGVQPGLAVAENLNGRIDVFVLDGSAHPALWRIGQTLQNGWEAKWSRLGAPLGQMLQPRLQVGRTLTGKLTVFALDRSGSNHGGNLWSIAQNLPSGAWGPWSALPVLGKASLRPGFVSMQNSDGRFELIAAGSDGAIYRLPEAPDGRWGKTWSVLCKTNKSDLTHSVFTAGNNGDGRLQVFATDDKGTVYSNWQQTPGGKWQSHWKVMESQTALALN